ncbi:MAG: GNAT family N-acetyltransferase, partial [Micromonosporaceae bacterium]
VETGVLPAADGGLTLVRQPGARHAAVLGFTAHHVVAADVDPAWARAQLPDGDLSAPLNPPFLSALSAALDRHVNNIDLVTLADPLAGPPPVDLVEIADRDHPRVRRALRYRDEVRVWRRPGGVVLIGRGLGGRWETAVEVDPGHRGNGLGRALALSARHLAPEGRPIWAQIAPGNAASVRAFLAAGFAPLGAEALLVRD